MTSLGVTCRCGILRTDIEYCFSEEDKKMIKRLTTYIAVAASLVLGACSEETLRPDVPDAGGEEGVRVSIAIPDMPRLATRAFGDTPAADLKLTVFEFEKGSDPTNTFLTKIYQAETLTQTNVANGATVDFRINDLLMTESPRVLHFVVAPQHLDAKYASRQLSSPTSRCETIRRRTGDARGVSQRLRNRRQKHETAAHR